MKYNNIVKGIFVSRPNRFVAQVTVNGKVETVHVKNTGRCKELLIENAAVYLEDFEGRMGTRKLRYSLIAVEKLKADGCTELINMDSQAPNAVIREEFEKSGLIFRSECKYNNSRFDFYFERDGAKGFLEVKGVTLEDNGICRFPDAPTERGVKHLTELVEAKKNGYLAAVLFLVQMENARHFEPNDETHPQFGQALRKADAEGVKILCYGCKVKPDELILDEKIPIILP